MEVEQRQLEAEISKLRRSFQYNEKRIQGLEEKQKKQDDRLLKRKRGDDNDEAAEDEQSNKKLRSVVSTVTERSPSPERRPQLKANPQDERRNRRLLGLLQGTLSKFSEQKRMEEKDERARMEVEKQIDTRIDLSHQETLQKEQERIKKEKGEFEARQEEVRQAIEEKCRELNRVRRAYHEFLMSNFGKTEGVTPLLYFMPAKLDEWTEQQFGIKNPRAVPEKTEPKKEEVDHRREREEGDGDDGEGDKEAVIVEIKEANEEASRDSAAEEEATKPKEENASREDDSGSDEK